MHSGHTSLRDTIINDKRLEDFDLIPSEHKRQARPQGWAKLHLHGGHGAIIVEDDIKESTREERHEMRQMIMQSGRRDVIEDNMKAIAKKMVQEALPNWQRVRVDNLLTAMRKEPGVWGGTLRRTARRGLPQTKRTQLLGPAPSPVQCGCSRGRILGRWHHVRFPAG